MNDQKSFQSGDPVNWVMNGEVMYGWVDEDCPPGTYMIKKVRVIALNRVPYYIEFQHINITE